MTPMATYVLIHGHTMSTETWNTLTIRDPIHKEDSHLGGKYWEGTVFALTAHHYLAFIAYTQGRTQQQSD